MRFNLEREALLASGIKRKGLVLDYLSKLSALYRQFGLEVKPPCDLLPRAQALFDWLWAKKPHRYQSGGAYRLHAVIDTQLDPDAHTVGNCLGLTVLYNCLLRTTGINAQALYLETAFGKGPHVLTLLPTEKSSIDIEHISPQGFDYKGHLRNSARTRWGDKELIADIYHSRGNDAFVKGDYGEALKNYDMALSLNPGYERALLNRAILSDRIGLESK